MTNDQESFMRKKRMWNLLYAALIAGVFVLVAAIWAPHCQHEKANIQCIDGHSYKMYNQYHPILLLDSLDRPVHCKE
jgi:predicted homoserine dehydrogenase-like protein